MHQSIERVLQYEGYANSDIIAHNGHATNGLKSQREALELTDAEFTVRPFASVSTQFWPFRNTGIGLGAQGRWYPFESRSESGFESLLAPYVATTKAKSFQLTASVTLAFR
jgi:hypothetical protein